jgi:hypothetical protein
MKKNSTGQNSIREGIAKVKSATLPKKAEPKKVEKNTKNQDKLMELIQDLPTLNKIRDGGVEKTEKKDVLAEVKMMEGKEWLQEQVGRLSEENEKLKKELGLYKEQYNALLQDRPIEEPMVFISPEEENIKREITSLFRELENNLFGRNPQKQSYKMVKVEHILMRMNSMFPFLRPS